MSGSRPPGFTSPKSPAAIPGLYTTDDVLIFGGTGWAAIVSELPCETVRNTLSAGDWTELAALDVQLLGAAGRSAAELARQLEVVADKLLEGTCIDLRN